MLNAALSGVLTPVGIHTEGINQANHTEQSNQVSADSVTEALLMLAPS